MGSGEEADKGIHQSCLSQEDLQSVVDDQTGSVLLSALLCTVLEGKEGGFHVQMRGRELRVEDLNGGILFLGGGDWHGALLDRLRQMASLPPHGQGIVQKGRFSFAAGSGEEPSLFRLSILKGVEGEEAQVKILLREGRPRSLVDLGFTAHQSILVRKALEKPGLVWVTAPGEEGLGSTLFGLLREIPNGGRTVTVEEEVFYRSPDFLQVETLDLGAEGRAEVLRELKGLDFDRVLFDRVSPAQLGELLGLALRRRWVLAATAEANLTETLSAISFRAAELPLYGLRLVVHQRLTPLLCPSCRVSCALGTAERMAVERMVPSAGTLFQEGEGCKQCGGKGTSGARMFFEVLPVDGAVREVLYAESRGEARLGVMLAAMKPSIRSQVGEAVGRGEVSLSELWDLL